MLDAGCWMLDASERLIGESGDQVTMSVSVSDVGKKVY